MKKAAKHEPERATEGAVFRFRGYSGGELIEAPYTVGPKCEENSGRWVCTTHREMFDNQMQKDGHINGPGKHVLAWWCHHHGPEVP